MKQGSDAWPIASPELVGLQRENKHCATENKCMANEAIRLHVQLCLRDAFMFSKHSLYTYITYAIVAMCFHEYSSSER
jgi:hypothetical protein